MKKFTIIISSMFLILFVSSFSSYADTTKDALMGLKKMHARCQTGISYHDYNNALADVKFPVNLYMESDDSKKYPELTKSIAKVIKHYEFAGILWTMNIRGSDIYLDHGFFKIDSDVGNEITESYPNASQAISKEKGYYYIGYLLPMIWHTAGEELENTTKLYAHIGKKSSNKK